MEITKPCSSVFIRVLSLLLVFLCFNIQSAVAVQFTLTPRTSVEAEHNDNIFRAAEPELAEADYITSAAVGLTGTATGRSAGLDLSYDPRYRSYANNSELNNWNHYANAGFWMEPARNVRLDITDRFSITEDPYREDDFTTRRGRFNQTNNIASGRLNYQFGANDTVYLGYAYRLLYDETPGAEDRDAHSPSLGLAYWFTPEWGVDISGAYDKFDYSGTTDDFNNYNGTLRLIHSFSRQFSTYVQYTHIERDHIGLTEDYKVYDPSAGINWAIADDFRLDLGVGYFVQDKKFSQDDSGIVIDLDIDKEWATRRSRFNITGAGGYDQPDFGTENLGFSLFYEAGATLTYGFTRFVSADVNAFFRSDEYINTFPKRTDENTRAGAGINWQAFRWCRLGLNYTYRTNESTVETADYVENRVTFRIDLEPSVPHRF